MPKIIYAAIKRHPPETYSPTRPEGAYELLQIGKANAPLENDRAFRHRLFNKFGEVPDCLILETLKPEQDHGKVRELWRDVFNGQLLLDFDRYPNEDDRARSKRLVKFWEDIFAESILVPGSALPAPDVSTRIEVSDPAVVALLRRLADDQVRIVGFSAEPGEPASLILTGDHAAVAALVAELKARPPVRTYENKRYQGGLLPPQPSV